MRSQMYGKMISQIILANLLLRIELTTCDDTFISLENVNYTVPDNETMEDSVIELGVESDHAEVVYDDSDTSWIKPAINQGVKVGSLTEIASCRFAKNATIAAKFTMYELFPEPPLKYFHWDVFDHCKNDFITCLRYLYETSLDAHLQYSVDTTTIMLEFWDDPDLDLFEKLQIIEPDEEKCKRIRDVDFKDPVPFESVLDRFVWRLTASYHMCWYTLKRQPELEYFSARCDNFASCFAEGSSYPFNSDYRPNNNVSFACAMYSFCPDPCCSNRRDAFTHEECDEDASNPCRKLSNKTCKLNATMNQSLTSIVYNQWNVTCACDAAGFEWKSRYGMCVDYDECHQSRNPCDKTQDCSNSKGSYFCYCKFGHEWSESQNRCALNEPVIRSLKRFLSGDDTASIANFIRPSPLWILVNLILIVKWIE